MKPPFPFRHIEQRQAAHVSNVSIPPTTTTRKERKKKKKASSSSSEIKRLYSNRTPDYLLSSLALSLAPSQAAVTDRSRYSCWLPRLAPWPRSSAYPCWASIGQTLFFIRFSAVGSFYQFNYLVAFENSPTIPGACVTITSASHHGRVVGFSAGQGCDWKHLRISSCTPGWRRW